MAKLFVLLLAVCVVVQVSYAQGSDEDYNTGIRNQLVMLSKLMEEPESANYANDIKKLMAVVEGALDVDTSDEKYEMISGAYENFSPEFREWFNTAEAMAIQKYLLNISNPHDTSDEKNEIISGAYKNFLPEFRDWFTSGDTATWMIWRKKTKP